MPESNQSDSGQVRQLKIASPYRLHIPVPFSSTSRCFLDVCWLLSQRPLLPSACSYSGVPFTLTFSNLADVPNQLPKHWPSIDHWSTRQHNVSAARPSAYTSVEYQKQWYVLIPYCIFYIVRGSRMSSTTAVSSTSTEGTDLPWVVVIISLTSLWLSWGGALGLPQSRTLVHHRYLRILVRK